MTPLRQCFALLASLALLAACRASEEPSEPAATASPTGTVPQLPSVEPPLDRRALLMEVAQAASDFAVGRDDRERQRRLGARRFEVALRFGCPGDESTTGQWRFDETTRVLRLSAEPDVTAQTQAVADLGFDRFEAVEGFWIRQPWLLDAACPVGAPEPPEDEATEEEAAGAAPQPVVSPAPRIGLAQFFTAEDPRTQRRERRGYQTTLRLAPDEAPSASGYDLVLSGRLERLPDGRAIACTSAGAAAPPACMVSVSFDHVAIRRPGGVLVAEWSRG
jgi:hypothetical protein